MCCSGHQAHFSNTKLMGAIIDHPTLGRIQIMGYSNNARNLHHGPNCMIIPIPAGEPITKENFLDPAHTKNVLNHASRAIWPPDPPRNFYRSRLIGSISRGAGVEQTEVGAYTVQWTDKASLILSALDRIPVEKRPVGLDPNLFSFYEEKYPGFTIALFCWESKWEISADPVFIWYYPLDGTKDIRVPTLDAHHGGPPQLGVDVLVDHEIFAGWPEMEGGIEMIYPETMSAEVREFMPDRVAGIRYRHHLMKNGDFEIECNDPDGHLLTDAQMKRTLPPGASTAERSLSLI